jgi:hypothetical protein
MDELSTYADVLTGRVEPRIHGMNLHPSWIQAKPSQAKPSQAKPSQPVAFIAEPVWYRGVVQSLSRQSKLLSFSFRLRRFSSAFIDSIFTGKSFS